MAADDNVLDVQVSHSVVDHGHDVEIDGRYEVGDVAVYEDLAGVEAHDFIRGYPTVAAADVSAFIRFC